MKERTRPNLRGTKASKGGVGWEVCAAHMASAANVGDDVCPVNMPQSTIHHRSRQIKGVAGIAVQVDI